MKYMTCGASAWKASEHLAGLVEGGRVAPAADGKLDSAYGAEAGAGAEADSEAGKRRWEEAPSGVILPRAAVGRVCETYELPVAAASQLYRAIEQAEIRLKGE
jgi:hypothetical protein